jgi:hypothetical protein
MIKIYVLSSKNNVISSMTANNTDAIACRC